MITQRLDLLSGDYNSAIIKAADILKNGGVVAIPTETVYGLAASAYSDEAIKKVFLAKGRPQDNPLIVHISNLEMLKNVAVEIPSCAYECAKHFWPGPFTMVLKKSRLVAQSVSAGLGTVAVRMPADSAARAVIEQCGIPLAAPSANTSGAPSPTKAEHVISDLDGKIDAVLMGGDCAVGIESTVISLCDEKPRLLRPGAVTVEQLREILPNIIIDDAVLKEPKADESVASPGMKYRHYSPKTESFLVEGSSAKFIDFVNSQKNCAAVCFLEEYDDILVHKISYGSGSDELSLAKNVFSVLRKVDSLSVDKIYIHAPNKSGVGLGVYNRLIRAAAFKVIRL